MTGSTPRPVTGRFLVPYRSRDAVIMQVYLQERRKDFTNVLFHYFLRVV